jgi:hypothetical protein
MDGAARTTERTPELEAVRQRRAELRDTLDALARTLAAPDSTEPSEWAATLRSEIDRLASDFALHVEVTEGPGGLHQAILAGDLRLANPVAALSAEHKTIAADIASLLAACEPPVADPQRLREQAGTVRARIVRHRKRGADLITEAYATDIGGCD